MLILSGRKHVVCVPLGIIGASRIEPHTNHVYKKIAVHINLSTFSCSTILHFRYKSGLSSCSLKSMPYISIPSRSDLLDIIK